MMAYALRWLVASVCALMLVGCAHRTPAGTDGLQSPVTQPATREVDHLVPAAFNTTVKADCRPPIGWTLQPAEKQPDAEHQLWISPTGATAYGVIVVRNWLMPLASDERILSEFLKNMKASDGRADLLGKSRDPRLAGGLGGLRFEVAGGKYTLRANLMSSGQRAWVVYAGTHNSHALNESELKLAEQAREKTVIEPAR